jgi:hypothetical protein
MSITMDIITDTQRDLLINRARALLESMREFPPITSKPLIEKCLKDSAKALQMNPMEILRDALNLKFWKIIPYICVMGLKYCVERLLYHKGPLQSAVIDKKLGLYAERDGDHKGYISWMLLEDHMESIDKNGHEYSLVESRKNFYDQTIIPSPRILFDEAQDYLIILISFIRDFIHIKQKVYNCDIYNVFDINLRKKRPSEKKKPTTKKKGNKGSQTGWFTWVIFGILSQHNAIRILKNHMGKKK